MELIEPAYELIHLATSHIPHLHSFVSVLRLEEARQVCCSYPFSFPFGEEETLQRRFSIKLSGGGDKWESASEGDYMRGSRGFFRRV